MAMGRYRTKDPLVSIYDGYCCWPGCEKRPGGIVAPLCLNHLLQSWRIVEATVGEIFDDQFPASSGDYAPRPKAERVPAKGMVYFIRFRDRIKIGWTADLETRLQAIPHDEVLHVQVGTRLDERRCHAAFAHLRERGEWFRAEPDLNGFIDDLRRAA